MDWQMQQEEREGRARKQEIQRKQLEQRRALRQQRADGLEDAKLKKLKTRIVAFRKIEEQWQNGRRAFRRAWVAE